MSLATLRIEKLLGLLGLVDEGLDSPGVGAAGIHFKEGRLPAIPRGDLIHDLVADLVQ